MLRQKKPLTRKTPLRAKAPMRSKSAMGAKKTARQTRDDTAKADEAVRKLAPLLETRAGPPFRSYERVGPWVADFVCAAARLVILIENADDPARCDWFEAQNYRVLVYTAEDALKNPQSVVDALDAAFSLRVVKP